MLWVFVIVCLFVFTSPHSISVNVTVMPVLEIRLTVVKIYVLYSDSVGR